MSPLKSSVFFIAVACASSACVSTPPYLAPANGPTASLTLKLTGGADHRASIFTSAADCRGAQSLGAAGGETKVIIPAEHPLSFAMESTGRTRVQNDLYTTGQCKIIASFTPQKGRDYLAEYRHIDADGTCAALVHEIVTAENGEARKVGINISQRSRVQDAQAHEAACLTDSRPVNQ